MVIVRVRASVMAMVRVRVSVRVRGVHTWPFHRIGEDGDATRLDELHKERP
jgi:hypothetical protein